MKPITNVLKGFSMVRCSKCQGLLIAEPDYAYCLNCSARYFPPDAPETQCSQCDADVWRDGLCQVHWRARMEMVNRYVESAYNRVRK